MHGAMVSRGAQRGWTAVLAGLALWCATGPASSQASPDELARKHFESGVAYLQESDYDSALRAFEKAYQLSKRPEILLNVATVHERAGDLPAAVGALERYLEAAPEGEHVETVKLRITNLKKRIEEPPTADAGAPQAQPKAPPPPPPTATAAAPAPTPAPDRLPAYVAFGVGGLAAAGAVLTGVLAQSEYDDAKEQCAPSCSDDELANGRALALTSTILTGVAVVSVGVGTVLWFTQTPGERPPNAARWDLRVRTDGHGARASAVWRF